MTELSASTDSKPASPARAPGLLLQRKCACGTHAPGGGECEECAGKRLQRKAVGHGATAAIPPVVHEAVAGSGAPLAAPLRLGMERHFGHDFSGVRIHHGSLADRSARAVHAHAYTVGSHVVFADGQFAPHTPSGHRLLAHELAHVVQQRRFSTMPTGIGNAGSVLERAADRAADQVMTGAGTPTPGTASRAQLLRQSADEPGVRRGECREVRHSPRTNPRVPFPWEINLPQGRQPSADATVLRVENISTNQKRVVMSGGQRYIVTRTPWTESGEGRAPRVSGGVGADREDVWAEVEWCAGASEGHFRIGANVPEEATRLLLDTIRSGGDVAAAWEQANITPAVTGGLRSGRWSLDVGAQATVGGGGDVQGAQGQLRISYNVGGRDVSVDASVKSRNVGDDPLGAADVSITASIPLEAAPRPPPRCDRHWTRSGFHYSCAEERDTPARQVPGMQDVTRPQEHMYNLFFDYAVAAFDDTRNADALAGLAADLQAGYQVAAIDAWASPEGPMDPGRRFMGNKALSDARAEAARRRIAAMCGETSCFASDMQAQGHGERMDPVDETGARRDVAGAELERHVTQTFPTDPGEASVRSPDLMGRLRRTPSRHQRAEQIYPTLRRAVVRLTRDQTSPEPCTFEIQSGTETRWMVACPPQVRRSAFPDDNSSP